MAKTHARIRDPVFLPLRVWKKFSRVLDHVLLAYIRFTNIYIMYENPRPPKIYPVSYTHPRTFHTLITLWNVNFKFIKPV